MTKILLFERRLDTRHYLHQSFSIFLTFLRSQIVVQPLVRQLVYKVYYTKYQVPLYLCQINKPKLKSYLVSIYYSRDCLKIFLLHLVMIQVFEIPLILLRKESSIEKKHLQSKLKAFKCIFLAKAKHAK